MVQRQPDTAPPPTGGTAMAAAGTAGEALATHLDAQAAGFLRALRTPHDVDGPPNRSLTGSARRISAALRTYEPLVDAAWADSLRGELDWLCATLCDERRCTARLARSTAALRRLAADRATAGGGMAVGAARAGALLERRLTLARARAHSAALRALGSARFHAFADTVALLASGPPLTARAGRPAALTLPPLGERAYRTLAEAADLLPLAVASRPYNGSALRAALGGTAGGDPADDLHDTPWHRVRILARTCRYALEVRGVVTPPGAPDPVRLYGAVRALERHREAADAATAAAEAARTPRITPATAYALGVLHADQRAEVESARHAFSVLWRPPAPRPAENALT